MTIALQSAKPAFAGEEVSLPVEVMNESRATRHGIDLALSSSGRERKRVDYIPSGKAARVTLQFPGGQRGEHRIGALCLTSAYPLGFIRFLKKFAVSQTYLVYPKPAGDLQLPSSRARSADVRPQADFGEGDDFSGVRAYVPGESQRHIDWKAVARGQPLQVSLADSGGAVRLLNVISGADESDYTALPWEARDYMQGTDAGVQGLRFGLLLGNRIFTSACGH